MTYCIYTNSLATEDELNDEHIFPLALGGSDNFTIRVSKLANTLANRELDEKLKSCPFLATNRKRHKARGHRGKSPSPPNTRITVGSDKSVAFKFNDNDLLDLYSHKRKKYLTSDDVARDGIKFSFAHERHLRLKFSAKVALASGYFVYGNTFVENAKIEDLRALMNYHGKLHSEAAFENLNSTGWSWPDPVSNADSTMHSLFQSINDYFDCSFVLIITSATPNKILFVIGVLGQLTGIISLPASCSHFPKLNEYDLGHVVALKNNMVTRLSFRQCLHEISIQLNSQ